MGYRARLGRIPKEAKEKYAGKTLEEVMEVIDIDKYSLAWPPEHEELYEIGKYVAFGDGCEDFYDFDIVKECESEFHIMDRVGLKRIIDAYHQNTLEYYQELKSGKEDIRVFLERKVNEWGDACEKFNVYPYWLDEEHTDGAIVRSWLMEYAIFNLIYIYRTFDWENDYLIYSAW